MKTTIASESVAEGHPDKVCDQISDAILDEFLKQDPYSRVAVETMATGKTVIVAGEVTSKGMVDIDKTVRNVLKEIGYTDEKYGMDYKTAEIIVKLQKQSSDIAEGVDNEGAGDQGMMYGYATDETKELMPLPVVLAHKLVMRMSEARKKFKTLGPDGKSQVSVEYSDGIPKRVSSIVIAQQHTEEISEDCVRKIMLEEVILPVCSQYMDSSTVIHVNGTGKFVKGGPAADTGLTGRKIIVDTYGGIGRHGGGAFSGKDPSKVDRSANYMARHIAKSIVANKFAKKCEVQLSYCIGVEEPTSISVDTFGEGKEEEIIEWVKKTFDLTPKGIINYLGLRKPVYRKTAVFGHFGRDEFSWEKVHVNYLGLKPEA